MAYTVITNPAARGGRAGRQARGLHAELRRVLGDVHLVETRRPGHATELARAASASAEGVVAVGGDGTIREVAAGLLAGEAACPLGIVPLGTGDDLARTLGVPRQARAAVRALAAARPHPIDAGRLYWGDGQGTHEACFVNAVGVGFDAQVAVEVARHKRLGRAAYGVALLRALRRWASPPAEVAHADGGGVIYAGPLFLVTVGNGQSAGGGFRLTPAAQPDDGWLDVCAVEALPARRVVRLLPQVVAARHGGRPEVYTARARALRVTVAGGAPLHADGEVLARRATKVRVEVIPSALRVLLP